MPAFCATRESLGWGRVHRVPHAIARPIATADLPGLLAVGPADINMLAYGLGAPTAIPV